MKGLVSKLNKMGFRTTLWMFPFFNWDCQNFAYVIDKNYVVMEPDSKRASLTRWWDGLLAAMIDPTNQEAADWFVDQLNKIRSETGIDSFKFDAGKIEIVF